MAKHIARIVVTILILSAVGYVVWAFLIKPKDNDYIYSQSLSVFSDENITTQNDITGKLSSNNYVGATKDVITAFDSEHHTNENIKNINTVRKFLFNINSQEDYEKFYGTVLNTDKPTSDFNSNILINVQNMLQTNMVYYTTYSQFVVNPTSDEVKNFKNLIIAHNTKRNVLLKTYNDILVYQKNEPNMIQYSVGQDFGLTLTYDVNKVNILTNFYYSLLNAQMSYYKAYANLADALRVYISNHTDGGFVYDASAVYSNSALESFKAATSVVYTTENFNHTAIAADVLAKNSFIADAFILNTGCTEYVEKLNGNELFKLVNSYNTLSKNYNSILFGAQSIFVKSQEIKTQLATDENSQHLASLNANYAQTVVQMLKIFGYEI